MTSFPVWQILVRLRATALPSRGVQHHGKRRRSPVKKKSTTRRQFLVGSAAAAATTACATGPNAHPIVKASARAPLGDDEPIRMGVIGTGGMGGGHIGSTINQNKTGQEKVEVVALAEVCKPRLEDRLRQARNDQDGVTVDGYRDYRELLARDDIHCVLIASPEHWHAQQSVDAIEAGKDVYVEKPMTLKLEDALWMREVMQANPDMRLQVGTQYMMYGKYQEAKKIIAEGGIGHPTFSQTGYCRNSRDGEWLYGIDDRVKPGEMLDWEAWCGPGGEAEWDTEVFHRWRRYSRWSTGIIGDLLVHMMTPMMFCLDRGWPTRVTCAGGHYVDKAMDNHDQVNLTVEFEKEHTMIVAGSTCNENGLEVMVRGHEADLFLGSNNCVLRPQRVYVDDIEERTIKCANVSPQEALRLDWLRCVRTREQNQSQVDLAAQVMVVVDLASRSAWDGRAWTFDPETMTASPA